ncbi:hypothetical protein T492DRAFT_1053544 [Pavlovales sp. CCMP2436]|nr:hypothetical protein T492DRAFT_1053544 [Pavlovales sp. CCMP2436]
MFSRVVCLLAAVEAFSVAAPIADPSLVHALAGSADGCEHVYLDCGSNIGVQVRKLYEPSMYPKARQVRDLFRRYFGEEDAARSARTCAFGWEPNPRLETRLRKTQAAYNALGWRAHFYTRTALSTFDGTAVLNAENAQTDRHAWASSITHATLSTMNETFTVATLNLASFLEKVIADRVMPSGLEIGKVVMKLDVEGEEYKIIPHLIETRALCVIDVIFIEWHARYVRQSSMNLPVVKAQLDAFLNRTTNPSCKTQVVNLDDESYGRARENPGLPVWTLSRTPYR